MAFNLDLSIKDSTLQIDLDFEREERQGFGEAIYGAGKNLEQLKEITRQHVEKKVPMLITRIAKEHAEALNQAFPKLSWTYREVGSSMIYTPENHSSPKRKGLVALVSAGSSDMPVVEEAAHTLEFFGLEHRKFSDCGVAGIHRLLRQKDELFKADLGIVVAGMDGALPSVVGGLVPYPVIAVPTSVGYGASFGGVSALLSMINSCASGLSVVNIDNGFGAAMAAIRMANLLEKA